MREIGTFQDYYEAIRKSNNIPEVWTEDDFEKQEIANLVRRSFRLGIQSYIEWWSGINRISRILGTT